MLDIWKVKRKEARILLTIPVTIEGLDKSNAPFREETVTDNVSKNGVCVILNQAVELGSVLTVKACQGKFKCNGEVRALWVDDNDRKKRIGLRFVEPTVNWVVS
ncbi:MAG: PilZ domain-containing protein [Acidobacteria bacterium]|nr:PilZ domain-containing protein [Acidobacteriota bacterium]MCI0623754.1 PilZ domain-containing protein [Acidobacteriota bacterium]MCI0721107.1 PilZ domain-containing protein [Acidobacteriota bacterium]